MKTSLLEQLSCISWTYQGDTLFANQVEAYNRLSDGFKERLHGLKATHSGIEQVTASKSKNGAIRREPVISVHPVVRTHPVTGEKALYVNPQCK
jgi:sulfonate dioxygenase